MRAFVASVVAGAMVAAVGASTLPDSEKDGYREVSKASDFAAKKDLAGGEAFLKTLRARPREKLAPLELLAEDMAEFALYRLVAETNEVRRAKCIDLLKKVQAAGPETIWGWSAYGFLDDYGATNGTVKAVFDPRYHLGDIVDGVIDFKPLRLEPGTKSSVTAAKLVAAERASLPDNPVRANLQPGSAARRAILRTELVRLCGAETIDRLLGMKGGEALFKRIWNDPKTLDAFLLSGPVFKPADALETLMTFYLNDPDGWTATEEGRKITVACAVNVRPQGEKTAADVEKSFVNRLQCWAAYRRLSQRKLFHESTAKRNTREWRFIVRDPTKPLEILHLNSLPFNFDHPGRMIGYVPYRYCNAFGGYILSRSSRYYDRWRFSDWPYWYMVHRVGGICNRQSTFAAVCANAHGLMAERAGQPNHCCWLRRDENGKWVIHNDINKYTAGVFMFWGRGYQYIQATERACGDVPAWERSELLRFRGALESAIVSCPYNVSAWQDYTEKLKADKAPARAWRTYLRELTKRCPEGRTATWDLAFGALDQLRACKESDAALLKDMTALFAPLREPTNRIPEEMDFRGVVMRRATGFFKKDKERQLAVLAAALEANWGTPHYFTDVLRHGLDLYSKDAEMSARFFKLFASEAAKHGGQMDGKTLDFRPLIDTASRNRQRDAFQMLVQLRNRLSPPPKGTEYPARDFSNARLVSAKGLIYTSGRVRGDCPEDYGRVIDASPLRARRTYQVAIKPPADPWAVVELPGLCKIAGVRVTGEKLGQTTVSISEDGKQWTLLETAPAAATDEVRVDCAATRPKAKYVRIGRVKNASEDVLRVGKILVYGETLY